MSATMTNEQKAMRLFAVLVAGCRPITPPTGQDVAIFEGETRLNALMFWLRNPDYLGWELLDLYEATGDGDMLALVARMIEDEEPVLRRDAMAKWRFGAFEPIDDEMAILSSRGLVRTVMHLTGSKSAGNDFVLLSGSLELADRLADNIGYHWYAERMKIVLRVAGSETGGGALKDRQYRHPDYATTRGRDYIPPITTRLVARLEALLVQGAEHV